MLSKHLDSARHACAGHQSNEDEMGLNDEAIEQLRRLVADTLGVDEVVVNLESGPETLPQWDSFGHIHLIVALEERFKIELDVDEIATMVSVREIARVLEQRGAGMR